MRRLTYVIVSLLVAVTCFGFTGGYNMQDVVFDDHNVQIALDTIPLEDRYDDDFLNGVYNPFDLQSAEITQEVEYDPETGNYILYEKIGDEFFRNPTYMTFEEYLEYQAAEQERNYFSQLAGVNSGQKSSTGKVDPISKIDVEKQMIDRLFGGNGVTIEPQGNIDLTFGFDYSKREDPSLRASQQVQGPFPDFQMEIQMNVDGKIGEKLNLGFNYDTQSTFDFDRKIKLEYDTEAFSEDDIIKKLEAGNVNMPLRSSLIQGSESLFGLKTELQFGKLRITGVVSQQRSNQENLSIEGGSIKQEFEVRPTEYDENRHFFLSHYHRDNYEKALESVPYINSLMQISSVEVWVSNSRSDNAAISAQIAAIADLGETDSIYNKIIGVNSVSVERQDDSNPRKILPDNFANNLYERLETDEFTRRIDNAQSSLASTYGLNPSVDYEIFRGRKLNASEFTYHEKLGFISLNVRLRTDQVLAVSYRYNYIYCGDENFVVGEPNQASTSNANFLPSGELDSLNIDPDDVIYAKLLKGSNQRVSLPSWDLMMKNVYPLGASSIGQEDFKFDIFFEDNSDGSLKRFLPEPGFEDQPLISVFNLDRLNYANDPQQDGIFDFVEGLTINTRTGSIYFPVLEPFGKSLDSLLGPVLGEKYAYQELYDNSITQAGFQPEKNLFVMRGEYKSSFASEISLGSWNLPRGSVRVTAGGRTLIEGTDYEIDYGIGRLRIINSSFLQPGTKIDVSFEDNSLFSIQQKSLFGLRADYSFNEDFNVGATYLRLSERPFTEKVNLGDDPINNRVYGLDLNYSTESDFITKAVDKLPFFSTKEKSNINFQAEVAALRPSHASAINLDTGEDRGGVVSLDDFEGAGSPIPLATQANSWLHASTPDYGPGGTEWPESQLTDDLAYGYNRAKLSWYVIDRTFRTADDEQDRYARTINRTNFFDVQLPFQITDLFTFDLSYYPDERGPYNFDPPGGIINGNDTLSAGINVDSSLVREDIVLNDPGSRWAGIMTYLNNNDFEASNIEYIDFWMLNPYAVGRNKIHDANETGELIFHLGSVSEDILKDNLQLFEHSIPTTKQTAPIKKTAWGDIPIEIPLNLGFDIETYRQQDIGYDGLDNSGEADHYRDYLDSLTIANLNFPTVVGDPAADDFVAFNDPSFPGTPAENDIIAKSKDFNSPQGNYPDNTQGGNIRGKATPDIEDMNGNSSLDQSEAFYEYRLPLDLVTVGGVEQIDETDPEIARFVRDKKTVVAPNGNEEIWYRFQIPVVAGTPINGIQGFRSIQFMRMIVKGFETHKTFRFADLEMVRNQWRRQPLDTMKNVTFSLDDVGIQENAGKLPFNYVLPRGIKQQQQFSSFATTLQDEKSLALNICDLPAYAQDSCEVSVFKSTPLDLRVFERMQLFVHAEQVPGTVAPVNDFGLEVFIRVGKDFSNNYYEYAMPVQFSEGSASDQAIIWPDTNFFDFALELFTDIKTERNILNADKGERFSRASFDPENENATLTIKGLPSLGYIKNVEIGVRNIGGGDANVFCGEVWVNELRLSGLQERGGMAGLARLEMDLADLGKLSSSANFSTIGWGALNQKVNERAKEKVVEYDISTDLDFGKFFPEKWGLNVPFYAQYQKKLVTPEFDAYELDLTIEEVEALNTSLAPDKQVDSRERSREEETVRTFNFTNIKKQAGGGKGGAAKPWSISNVSLSYAQTEGEKKDFLIKEDKTKDQRAKVEYTYSTKSNYLKPFKKVKGKWLKFVKEFNFNPFPNSYYVNTELRRFKNTRTFREPIDLDYTFDDQRFNWDRNYGLRWDLSKNLKTNFDATTKAVIDELRQEGIRANAEDRPWVDAFGNLSTEDPDQYWKNNFKDLGRNKEYTHKMDVTYNVPLKNFPLTDWITVKAKYNTNYRWTAAALNLPELGHIAENNQKRTLNASLAFDKLYKKSKFLKNIQNPKRKRSSVQKTKKNSKTPPKQEKKPKDPKAKKKKKDDGPSGLTRALIRPLLLMRSIKVNYSEDLGTLVPGIHQDLETEYLGLSNGFNAPGWAFVAGLQPRINGNDDWLDRGAAKGWFSTSELQNNQLVQRRTTNFDVKVDIEPIKDFKVEINFKKKFSQDHFENFKIQKGGGDEFQHLALRDVGSLEVSYSGFSTIFDNHEDVYARFKQNTQYYSNQLGTGAHRLENLYNYGYGSTQTDVVLPSFIAAYAGKDVSEIDPNANIVDQIGANNFIPRPNWTLRYTGLKKWGPFKDFVINHGYKSVLVMNRYETNLDYEGGVTVNSGEIFDNYDLSSSNYYSRFEIPLVQLVESFSPLIGIKLKTKNDISLNFQYKKTRSLDLRNNIQSKLEEKRTSDITFGFGYIAKGVNIGFLTGDKGKKKRAGKKREGKEDEKTTDKKDAKAKDKKKKSVNANKVREMTFNIDFSLVDNATYIFELDGDLTPQKNRGQRQIRISPSIDYNVNEQFTLKWFLDYGSTTPKINPPFKFTTYYSGLTARFNLN